MLIDDIFIIIDIATLLMPLLIAIDDYFDIIIDIAITLITPLIIDIDI
jgi:hypothetical protein